MNTLESELRRFAADLDRYIASATVFDHLYGGKPAGALDGRPLRHAPHAAWTRRDEDADAWDLRDDQGRVLARLEGPRPGWRVTMT